MEILLLVGVVRSHDNDFVFVGVLGRATGPLGGHHRTNEHTCGPFVRDAE